MARELRIAILYRSHFYNRMIERQYRKLRDDFPAADVILGLDITKIPNVKLPPDVRAFTFTTSDLKAAYPQFRSMMYNCEYPALYFWQSHPDYDYYWLIDNDVRFTGNWSEFLTPFSQRDDYALLACIARSGEEEPDFSWKDHKNISLTKPFYVFYSVVRFSNVALALMDKKFREGVEGFVEVIGSSLVYEAGMKVGDFSGKPQWTPSYVTRKFYTDETFRYRPIRWSAGHEKGMLYHPVKHPLWHRGLLTVMFQESWHKYIRKNKSRVKARLRKLIKGDG